MLELWARVFNAVIIKYIFQTNNPDTLLGLQACAPPGTKTQKPSGKSGSVLPNQMKAHETLGVKGYVQRTKCIK